MKMVGKSGATAELTHFAFGQLAARAEAPASYLRTLPATLACQNLNHGLKSKADPNAEAKLLLHENGGYFIRAVTSGKYTRIWNSEVAERLLGLESDGWRVPPARPLHTFTSDLLKPAAYRYATKADAALSLTVREGDPIGPSGLYASNEDMFAFMIHPERVIRDGSPGGLMRGFM